MDPDGSARREGDGTMHYPHHGYAYGNYVGIPPGYEQARTPQTHAYQQTQQQHPMVVIPSHPSQSVGNVPHFQAQPQFYHRQPGPPQPPPVDYYSSQHNPQYSGPTLQQTYRPQHDFSPEFAAQHLQRQFGSAHQATPTQPSYYHAPPPQRQYPPPSTLNPRVLLPPKKAPQPVSQQAPHRSSATYTQASNHPLSSPDPLQASPQMSHPRVELHSSQRQVQQGQSRAEHYSQHRAQPASSQPQESRIPHEREPSQAHDAPNMSNQRVFARVEIPHSLDSSNANGERPPKRRKSNEGHAFPSPMCDPAPVPRMQKKSSHTLTPLQSPPISSRSELPSSDSPAQLDVDCQAVLLALADEYTVAAYSMSAALVTADQEDQYYSLISTAMGCLQSALTHYRQSDHRAEARLRLRLATLMVEETENQTEAEEVLGKGIALCERSRLYDLKYAMHHLLARLTFSTSPKAALRSIDKLIHEIETLNLTHWLYCYRLLRVSLSLQGSMRTETHATLKHLAAISATAHGHRDISIQIIASVLEGLVHLRSGTEDGAEMAQRAFTAARAHQLSDEMKSMPQISGLLDCLDLCRCLMDFSLDQLDTKLQIVEKNVDVLAKSPAWNKTGSIYIRLVVATGDDLEKDTCGIFRKTKHAQITLPFQWITKTQLYTFAYALSGYTRLYKNSESTKAEAFFREAQKLCQQPTDPVLQSLRRASQYALQRHRTSSMIHMLLAFALCARFEWSSAQEALSNAELETHCDGVHVDDNDKRIIQYLKACCKHGLGDLEGAQILYRTPDLALHSDHKMPCHERDIRLLAAMNHVLISRTLGNGGLAEAGAILARIDPHAQQHRSRAMKAAYYIILATGSSQNTAIMKTKQYLQVAIDTAKTSSNNQLLSIVMSVMTETLFANIVGEQAEKSARAGVSLAKRARHPLWIVVANGLYGSAMERCGKHGEAQVAKVEAQGLLAQLPASLKQSMKAQLRE